MRRPLWALLVVLGLQSGEMQRLCHGTGKLRAEEAVAKEQARWAAVLGALALHSSRLARPVLAMLFSHPMVSAVYGRS